MNNKQIYTIKIMSAIIAGLMIMTGWQMPVSAKTVSPAKPVSFSIEPTSRLRSPELRPERAAPVIYNNIIYIASSRKKLVSFDLTGKKLGSIELKFSPLATPGFAEGRMFVGGDDGDFHCLDIATGKELWSNKLKTIDFSAPAFAAGNVIFQTGNDRILALDMMTGEWRW